jgi:outer membrane murein-binding lipoprotein Lpp
MCTKDVPNLVPNQTNLKIDQISKSDLAQLTAQVAQLSSFAE